MWSTRSRYFEFVNKKILIDYNFFLIILLFERYDNLTSTSLTCRLKGSTIGIFNVSMIVSEDNGRSDEEDTMYYVTPGELLYNFQTYAGNLFCMKYISNINNLNK